MLDVHLLKCNFYISGNAFNKSKITTLLMCRLGVGQPLMMVRVQAGGGAASYDGTCAGWGSDSLL